MNGLSTLLIVVIAVGGGVIVGLAVSCYIWRGRNSERFLSFFSVLEYDYYTYWAQAIIAVIAVDSAVK